MIISPLYTAELKEIVRHILRFHPTISIAALQRRLKEGETPRDHSMEYITAIVKEVREERIQRIRELNKEELVAHFGDIVEFVCQQLRAIAQEEKIVVENKDAKMEARIFGQSNRIKALNSIIINYEKLLNITMDLGLLDRKLGTTDVRVLDILAALKHERNLTRQNNTVPTDNGAGGTSGTGGENEGGNQQVAG